MENQNLFKELHFRQIDKIIPTEEIQTKPILKIVYQHQLHVNDRKRYLRDKKTSIPSMFNAVFVIISTTLDMDVLLLARKWAGCDILFVLFIMDQKNVFAGVARKKGSNFMFISKITLFKIDSPIYFESLFSENGCYIINFHVI